MCSATKAVNGAVSPDQLDNEAGGEGTVEIIYIVSKSETCSEQLIY